MKKKTIFIVAILAISLIAFSGCSTAEQEKTMKEPPKQNEEVTDTKTKEPIPKTEESVGEIRQELIDFLNSYEDVMDEYIEFMKNYKPNDITMLSKYTEILQKYTEFAQKVQTWENKDLNNEELIYYTKVLNRVNEKLLEVSLGN